MAIFGSQRNLKHARNPTRWQTWWADPERRELMCHAAPSAKAGALWVHLKQIEDDRSTQTSLILVPLVIRSVCRAQRNSKLIFPSSTFTRGTSRARNCSERVWRPLDLGFKSEAKSWEATRPTCTYLWSSQWWVLKSPVTKCRALWSTVTLVQKDASPYSRTDKIVQVSFCPGSTRSVWVKLKPGLRLL